MFTPYLGVKLLPDMKGKHTDEHDAYNTRFYRLLRTCVTLCVSHPIKVVGTTLVMFIASIYGFTRLQQQFFPQSSRPELSVDIKLPDGSSFVATSAMVKRIEELLKPDMQVSETQSHPQAGWKLPEWLSHSHDTSGKPDVEYFTSYTGAGAARFFLALNPDLPNPSFAKIVIQTSGRTCARAFASQVARAFCHRSRVCRSTTACLAFGLRTSGWIPSSVSRDGPRSKSGSRHSRKGSRNRAARSSHGRCELGME